MTPMIEPAQIEPAAKGAAHLEAEGDSVAAASGMPAAGGAA
jgi:hypothetical protein